MREENEREGRKKGKKVRKEGREKKDGREKESGYIEKKKRNDEVMKKKNIDVGKEGEKRGR